MTAHTWIIALALLAAAAGCGDNRAPSSAADAGAPADSGADGAPFTPSSIEFLPDDGAHTGALWLELDEARPPEKRFTLKVVGDGFEAYGVAGRLLFDPAVTSLAGIVAGDALAGNDAELVAAAAGNRRGGYFGVSRSLGTERTAVTLTAAATVGTLDFTVAGPGTTRIRWNHVRSLVIDGQARPVAVATWLGGTLIVK